MCVCGGCVCVGMCVCMLEGFLGELVVQNPQETWETWVWSLGWEDPLDEGMATDSSILAWRIPYPEELGGL